MKLFCFDDHNEPVKRVLREMEISSSKKPDHELHMAEYKAKLATITDNPDLWMEALNDMADLCTRPWPQTDTTEHESNPGR